MIGGIEVRIPLQDKQNGYLVDPKGVLEAAVQATVKTWRQAVYLNAETAEEYDDISEIPFWSVTEIFVYQDALFRKRWEEEGAVESLHNTMVHLILNDDLLTLVVDDPAKNEVKQILQAIQSAVRALDKSLKHA